MKRRTIKKLCAPGSLITVKGTQCVFMSLGMETGTKIGSFNGINLSTGDFINRCDGTVRPSTASEKKKYWECMKVNLGNRK